MFGSFQRAQAFQSRIQGPSTRGPQDPFPEAFAALLAIALASLTVSNQPCFQLRELNFRLNLKNSHATWTLTFLLLPISWTVRMDMVVEGTGAFHARVAPLEEELAC